MRFIRELSIKLNGTSNFRKVPGRGEAYCEEKLEVHKFIWDFLQIKLEGI
jgi:hypothetical protein